MLLYKNGSASGRELAEKLNVEFRNVGSVTPYRCINWGSGTNRLVQRLPTKWLNNRSAVETASNKKQALMYMQAEGVTVPEFTTSKDEAKRWAREGTVFCRTLLRANQGRGIVVAKTSRQVVDAQLYTKGVENDREYRVHVFSGEVIGASRKIEHPDYEEHDTDVRNHDRGWMFSLCDTGRVHDSIKSEALLAVQSLGLDFGAVDLIWNRETGVATVLEVNTAPGIEGTILEAYIQKFTQWINGRSTPLQNFRVSYTKITRADRNGVIQARSRSEAEQLFRDSLHEDDIVENLRVGIGTSPEPRDVPTRASHFSGGSAGELFVSDEIPEYLSEALSEYRRVDQ
jgi:glutathione synthase/RimK-type ligase-like ATP-grasp enzyme